MIYVYERSAVAECDRQLLRDFQQKIPDSKMTTSEIYQSCDIAVMFGSWKKLSKKDYKWARAPHHILKDDIVKQHGRKPIIIIETPLLGRTIGRRHNYYRVGLNHYLNNLAEFNNKDCKPDRFNKLGLSIKPWRTNGEHILVLGQNLNDASLLGADMDLWVTTTIRHLLRITKRPIVFRDHPENSNKIREVISRNFHDTKQVEYDENMTIRDSLQNAHCCVAYTSGSSLDAILDGVPVIPTSQYNFVWEISSHSINDIENPKLGEREQLLYNLAYAQWSVQEIQKGKPWDHLYEYISSHNI